MLIIHTDGACVGNPGPMGIGIVISREGKTVREISEYIGEGTNNVAEYTAVIRALEEAKKLGGKEVLVRADSELVVQQMNGKYKVKNSNLKLLKQRVDALRLGMRVRFEHVPREKNAEADALSKKAVQGKAKSTKADRSDAA